MLSTINHISISIFKIFAILQGLLLGNFFLSVSAFLLFEDVSEHNVTSASSVFQVYSLSLYSHLQVNISDPFDDPMRGPYQWIHILMLALCPASLQRLEVKQTLHSTEILICHESIPKYTHITVTSARGHGAHSHLPPCQN